MTAPPVSAKEETRGWLERILVLFDRPDDEAVDVPERGAPAEASRAVASPDSSDRIEGAQRPPARSSVEFPERRAGMTPSHALQTTRDIVSEIDILREELGVDDFPPETELMGNRAPIHVYAKSLEVLKKVVSTQYRMGTPVGRVGRIPFRRVEAADIVANLEYILEELREIKAQRSIDREIEPAPLGLDNTSYLMIYIRLTNASFMLDGLRGQSVTTDDVYRIASSVLDEMVPIGEKLDATLNSEVVEVKKKAKPIDVARQVARATFRVVNLEMALQMDTSSVPATNLAHLTSSEHYDAINMLLAEMARIKLHLGIDIPRADRAEPPTGTKTRDVLGLTTLIVENLDSLALAAWQ